MMRRLLSLGLVMACLGCGSDDGTSSNDGPGTGGSNSGGSSSGGNSGSNTGGSNTGGSNTGGSSTGGTGNVTYGIDGWSLSSGEAPHYFLQPDADFRVEPTRPRLYFRQADVEFLKSRMTGPLAEQRDYLEWMASSMFEQAPSSATATDDVKGWFGDKGIAIAFIGLMDQKQDYIDWAVDWAKALGAGTPPSDDTPLRARLQRIATVYDWLHDEMSDADREQVKTDLIKYVETLAAMGIIQDPGYVGGHERWGYAVFAMGVIALKDDWDKADEYILQTREHIGHGFFPTQQWLTSGGGYHMGWAYSSGYTNPDLPYLIWTVGTNDVVLDDWMSQTADYYLYGRRGDDKLPEAGDAFSVSLDQGVKNVIYAAGIGQNPYAKWYLEDALEPSTDSFLQILSVDPNLDAKSPADLPLGREFGTSGVVIARDGWDANTTHFTFKSSHFFSINHHHRDENGFLLHYKGILAIDSGVYDSYGSSHWDNYYTRTVAHNAILVEDPAQNFTLYGQPVSNDGGQIFKTDPDTLADIQPGGDASLDGITHFENTDQFTYASGDATRAYDSARVTLAQRDFVYLRDTSRTHPVVLIFDRVGATNASFQKKFLLHTSAKPTINGKLTVSSAGGGRLTTYTLLPTSSTLTTVGGSGKEFFVDGQNFAPTTTKLTPGSWRLEVSPTTEKQTDYLLHALFVDDDGATAVSTNDAKVIDGSDASGTEIAGWTVVFSKSKTSVTSLTYETNAGGNTTHLVSGLTPGANVTFSVNGSSKGSATVGPGGVAVLAFSAPAAATVEVN
jgi:hypothetical protein